MKQFFILKGGSVDVSGARRSSPFYRSGTL